jgi:integrase
MARTIKDAALGNRKGRLALKVRADPYFRSLQSDLHLGYRRRADGSGTWIARRRVKEGGAARYVEKKLGAADDYDGPGLTFDQALKAAQAWQPSGQHDADTSPMTVRKAFKLYVEYLRSHRTAKESYWAEGVLLGTGGEGHRPRKSKVPDSILDTLVVDLTRAQLEAWQAAQVRRTDPEGARRDKDTANRILTAIKAALNRIYDDMDNNIPSDAAWSRVSRFEDVARGRQLHLTADQAVRLLNAIGRGALYNMVAFCFLSGIRPGNEIRALTVGDFRAEDRTVTLRSGKTGGRVIWLNEEAVILLTQITAGRPADATLFVKDDGTPWGDANEWLRPLKAAAARIGLSTARGGVCLYTARHSHISQALVSDHRMPVQMLAENAGTSVEMIERHYGKFLNSDRKRMIEAGTAKLGLATTNVVKLA